MIQQVTIKNFKCLRNVAVSLERFTIFVGANGSGKTSVLQAIDFLCRAFRGQARDLNAEILKQKSHGSAAAVEIECLSEDVRFRYRSVSAQKSQPQGKWDGSGSAIVSPGNSTEWKKWQPENMELPRPVWLQLDPNALRTSGPADRDPRRMTRTGQGLHSATASMALEHPDVWQVLQTDLIKIVPSIRRLRHSAKSELLFDTINGKDLKATQVSEGTLLTLGLLTAIHGISKPGILLLDDLDRALHPKAQRELIDLLREVQKSNPEIQIVGSTHSPYLLGKMEPNEVQVTYLRDDGSTACEPLTHHPSFSKWRDEFHPGEMWSLFGEQWVGQPEAAAK